MSKNQDLQTIDPTALAQVSGGARTATSTSSSTDDQLLTALTGIADSLKNMNTSSGGFDNNTMMLFMMMMMNNRGPTVVAQPAPAPYPPYYVVPR
jgi:hypothetical protein